MAADRIEREIVIEAPPEIVWGVITAPEQISRWLSDDADFEARAGADGTLTWTPGGRGGAKGSDVIVPIHVVDAEPFHRFTFRWNHAAGEKPDERNSALVEFTLADAGGRTRLRVVESGIGAVTDDGDGRRRYLDDHENGWGRHLGELRDQIASQPPGVSRRWPTRSMLRTPSGRQSPTPCDGG
ncbi:MAG: SRPBCC domain-containing protein [Solirubrobacteraceae bacterium]